MLRFSRRMRSATSIYEGIPRYPDLSVLGGLRGLDYVGTAAFAVGGSMVAAECGLTGTGCIVVGTITALGGGCLRDVLFDKKTFIMEENEYVYIAVGCAAAAFAVAYGSDFPFKSLAWRWILWWMDTIGLATFTIIGTMFGVRLYIGSIFSLMCGLLTATGGGVVRDLLCRRPPRVLHNHQEAYAETCLGGGFVYLFLRSLQLPIPVRVMAGVWSVVSLRLIADKMDFHVPVKKGVDRSA